jgi:hypothetical protein
MPEDQDWRLEAELDGKQTSTGLDHLVHRIRGGDDGDVADDVRGALADGVVVTHDGRLLFAYAASESAIGSARRSIEFVLQRDGYQPTIAVAHWDHDLDDWRQVEPQPDPTTMRAADAAVRRADAVETRTIVCTAGKFVRGTLEQSMLERAGELGIECKIVEHPHLLTSQVAFTVTGPRRKLDEFRDGLRAEGLATLRFGRSVLNPL